MDNKDLSYGYSVPFTKIHVSSSHHEIVYDTSINGTCSAVIYYPDVTSIHRFENDDVVYAVYAIWGTGDSSVTSIASEYEVFGLFKELSVAQELLNYLEEYESPMLLSPSTHLFETSDGQTIYLPHLLNWHGYFDQLSELEIAALRYI